MTKSKVCTRCKKRKLAKKFHERKNRKNELYSWCIPCMRKYYKKWSKTKKGILYVQKYTRKYQLMKKFGITAIQYTEMFELQNGVCAICKEKETRGRKRNINKTQRLAVDHNDKTGQVRGLLCSQCNRHLLGSLKGKNEIQILKNAIKYLQEANKRKKKAKKKFRRIKRK